MHKWTRVSAVTLAAAWLVSIGTTAQAHTHSPSYRIQGGVVEIAAPLTGGSLGDAGPCCGGGSADGGAARGWAAGGSDGGSADDGGIRVGVGEDGADGEDGQSGGNGQDGQDGVVNPGDTQDSSDAEQPAGTGAQPTGQPSDQASPESQPEGQPESQPEAPSLPVTGSRAGTLVGVGLALLAIGWLVIRTTRRRPRLSEPE